MLNQKQYDQARKAFAKLGSFKDASRKASDLESKEAQYKSAVKKYKSGNYAQAEQEFRRLYGYKDSASYAEKAKKEQEKANI